MTPMAFNPNSAPPHPARLWLWLVPLVLAALLGAIVPSYVDSMGDSVPKLLVLPALILLAMMLAYSRIQLLLLIVLVRGATETAFEATRVSLGGVQLGVGGLLNAFAILIAAMLILERPRLFTAAIGKIWGVFLLMLAVGVATAAVKGDAIRLSLSLLSNVAVFIGAFYYVRSREAFASCVKLVLWSSLIPAVYGLLQFATGRGYESLDAGMRINSTFSHPNPFGFYLTLVISLVLYVLRGKLFMLTSARKTWLTLYLFVLIALLLLTKTRSAWVACFALFFGYGLLFERRFLVYLVIGSLLTLFIPEVHERLIDLTQGTGNSISSTDQLNSFAWRVSVWESGLSWMTPSHYLLGYGLGSFQALSPTFFKEGGGINWGAHSVYVQLIFELGVVGFLAFVWIFLRLIGWFSTMLRSDKLCAFVLMLLGVEYLVIAASDNMLDYLSFNWYVWFLFGAGLSLTSLLSRDEPEVFGVAKARR